MNKIIDYFVPSQDPILGIKAANVVKKLDSRNWQSKALICQQQKANHYIYLSLATNARERKRYYCVNTYDIDQGAIRSRELFQTTDEALAFANPHTPDI